MKYGLNTVLWVYPFSSEHLHLLKKIKDIGYDTVEMSVEDHSEKNVKNIKKALDKLGLESVIVGIPGPEQSIFSDDKSIQEKGKDYLKGLIDLCVKLGSRMLIGPEYSAGIHPEMIKPDARKRAWEICVNNFKELGRYASDKGIKIALEPLNRYETSFINTADDGIALVKDIGLDSIGIQLDVYHMNIEEKNLEDAIIRAGKYLYHMHVPEHDRGTPGTGHTDWEGVARGLKKISYNGAVVIESCDPKIGSPLAEMGAIWRTYDQGQEAIAENGYKFIKKIFK
jgi:D-psicose/D-tagatose/L-ribulose 3-epimerase